MKDLKAVFNPAPVDDWEAWKAEEISIERVDDLALGLEYAQRGRL